MRLTPKEAADRLGVSVQLVYQLCHERRLVHYRIGGEGRRGRVLIDEADLDAFMQSCKVEADNLPTDVDLPHLR